MTTPDQWNQGPNAGPPVGPVPPPGQCAPPPYAPYPAPPPGYVPARSTNGFAIASMVLGILWIYCIGSILALVFGYIARSQIRERDQAGGGMAVAGIVLGWVGLALSVVGLALMVWFTNQVEPTYDPQPFLS